MQRVLKDTSEKGIRSDVHEGRGGGLGMKSKALTGRVVPHGCTNVEYSPVVRLVWWESTWYERRVLYSGSSPASVSLGLSDRGRFITTPSPSWRLAP